MAGLRAFLLLLTLDTYIRIQYIKNRKIILVLVCPVITKI